MINQNTKPKTVEEKEFCIKNAPNAKLLSYSLSYVPYNMNDEGPWDEICFFTEEGFDAYEDGNETECLVLTLFFNDKQSPLKHYLISACDFIQIFGDDKYDFVYDRTPNIFTEADADENGNFHVSFILMTREYDEEKETLKELMAGSNPSIVISELVVSNIYAFEDKTLDGYTENLIFDKAMSAAEFEEEDRQLYIKPEDNDEDEEEELK